MPDPESLHKSFIASQERIKIIRQLVLEFAGVIFEEIPTDEAKDFMSRVSLTFTSAGQGEAFMKRMFEVGRQEMGRRDGRVNPQS